MTNPNKASFDALSEEKKQAAKRAFFMVIACFAGAAISMIALFVYMVWSGPKPNFTIAAVWFGATIVVTSLVFNMISGRLRGVMRGSKSNDTP